MKHLFATIAFCCCFFFLFGQSPEAKSLIASATKQMASNPNKAIELSREAVKMALTKEAWTDYKKAINLTIELFEKQKQIQPAIVFLEKESAAAPLQSGKSDSSLAHLFLKTAYLLDNKIGNYTEAEKYYLKALKLLQKVHGEEGKALIPIYCQLGNLHNLSKLEKPQESFNYYQQALNLSLKHNGADAIETADIYNDISTPYRMMNKFEMAKDHQMKALAIYKAKGDKKGEASIYMALGHNSFRKQEYQIALDAYLKGLAIIEKQKQVGEFELSNIHANIASAYLSLGNNELALKYMKRKYDVNKKIFPKHHPKLARACFAILDIYIALEDTTMALKIVHEGLIAASVDYEGTDLNPDFLSVIKNEKFLNPAVTGNVFSSYADVYVMQYKLTGDLINLKRAAAAIEALSYFIDASQQNFSVNEDQLELRNRVFYPAVRTGLWVYAELYKLTKEKKYVNDAYHLLEQNKSVYLATALQADDAGRFAGLPDTVIQREKQLQQQIGQTEQGIIEARSKKNTEKLTELTNRLSKLNLQKTDFVATIEKRYPKYFDLKYKIELASPQLLQQKVLTKDVCLLEYFEAANYFYVFIIDNKNVDLKVLPKGKTFAADLKEFRKALSDFTYINKNKEEAYNSFTKIAHTYYKELIEPILNKNAAYKDLIIIPDGSLGHIPFEVLLMEKAPKNGLKYESLKYLLQKYALSYSYSGTLLLKNMNRTAQNNNAEMLAFAANYENGESSLARNRSGALRNLRQSLSPLPAARSEVEALEKQFSGAFCYDQLADEKNFKTLAAKYGIIHLAMHGILDKNNPILSNLAFTETGDSTEDNFLHAHEISNMALNASLVVLSACETGYGKTLKGEGVMSLARSFMYAGTPALVVSLWQVNDNSTALLMQSFYKGLSKGLTKSEALRQAKLEYMRGCKDAINRVSTTAHPAYWAAFIQMGDPAPISLNTKSSFATWLLWGGAALAAILLAWGGFRFLKRGK